MNAWIRFAAIALFLIAASGCEKVQFQSPPTLPLAQCDAAFVGSWRVEDPSEDADGTAMYVRVSERCADWIGVEVDSDDALAAKIENLQEKMDLGFAAAGEQRYVASLEHQGPDADADSKPEGYVLARYSAGEDLIELRLLDATKAAHLIIDDALPGWVEKRDRDVDGRVAPLATRHYVYVFGNAEETSAALQRHGEAMLGPLWLRLRRVDAQTQGQIDAWIAAAKATQGDGE